METSAIIIPGAVWIHRATSKKIVLTDRIEYKWLFARDIESHQLLRLKKKELLEHYDYYPSEDRRD